MDVAAGGVGAEKKVKLILRTILKLFWNYSEITVNYLEIITKLSGRGGRRREDGQENGDSKGNNNSKRRNFPSATG